ncbi:MAG TPA: DUF2062 domain-containing protein [Gammaproteobacteria bacterium]|nr:DUF2062 domain-containing protein [Gammaproteobacteria bacterium]
MPRRIIKRYLPDHNEIKKHRYLQCFGRLLHDPLLWHLNRRSVPGAMSVGLFCAFIPVPFQMLIAAGLAIFLRVNLPLSVALVWITNPLTMPPIFYFAYKFGAWLLDAPVTAVTFELSWEWLEEELTVIWQPFLLGCFVLGTLAAALGNVVVRIMWHIHIVRYIKIKRAQRLERKRQTQLTQNPPE